MIRRPSLSLLLVTMAACIFGGRGLAAAQKLNSPPIQIEIDSVTASNSPMGVDPKLKKMPLMKLLPAMFGYTSYHLDSRQTQRTVCGRILTFSLPAGRFLHIAPLKIDGERVNMEIVMFDGAEPRVTMRVTMQNRSTLILGGPHYPLGMLIVMVNTGIVGAAPPALPKLAPPRAALPRASASPQANTVPQAIPASPPDLNDLAPISAHQ